MSNARTVAKTALMVKGERSADPPQGSAYGRQRA
jgi:hypothetical protein